MEIGNLTAEGASAIQQSQVQNRVDVALAKKQLDSVKQQGAAALEMLRQAAETAGGIDLRA